MERMIMGAVCCVLCASVCEVVIRAVTDILVTDPGNGPTSHCTVQMEGLKTMREKFGITDAEIAAIRKNLMREDT